MIIDLTYDHYLNTCVVDIRDDKFHFSIELEENELKNLEVQISEILRFMENRKQEDSE